MSDSQDLQPTGSVPASTPSTFSDAVETEPLARACITALGSSDNYYQNVRGSGLKVLRLVSRQLLTVMTRNNIRGYTLLLDGKLEDLPDVRLLKFTRLSRLHVVVVGGESFASPLVVVNSIVCFLSFELLEGAIYMHHVLSCIGRFVQPTHDDALLCLAWLTIRSKEVREARTGESATEVSQHEGDLEPLARLDYSFEVKSSLQPGVPHASRITVHLLEYAFFLWQQAIVQCTKTCSPDCRPFPPFEKDRLPFPFPATLGKRGLEF